LAVRNSGKRSGAQTLEFREREIFGEPAGDRLTVDHSGGLARGKLRMRSDVRGAADLVFMPREQRAVPGNHQVGFHVVRTLLNRDEVAGECVLGHIPAGAAVRYDKWPRIGGRRAFRHENCAQDSEHDVTRE
jgi:hypothetical protein